MTFVRLRTSAFRLARPCRRFSPSSLTLLHQAHPCDLEVLGRQFADCLDRPIARLPLGPDGGFAIRGQSRNSTLTSCQSPAGRSLVAEILILLVSDPERDDVAIAAE